MATTTAADLSTYIGTNNTSQAFQDDRLTALELAINGTLGSDGLDDKVTTLKIKASAQTWGSITGTTFSSKLNVGGVTLNTSSASTFNDGISASATISSTTGTSSLNALNISTSLELIEDDYSLHHRNLLRRTSDQWLVK